MTRLINYSRHVTYSLDSVIENIRDNDPDLSPEDLEKEARAVIDEWAAEEFGVTVDYLYVTEEQVNTEESKGLEY